MLFKFHEESISSCLSLSLFFLFLICLSQSLFLPSIDVISNDKNLFVFTVLHTDFACLQDNYGCFPLHQLKMQSSQTSHDFNQEDHEHNPHAPVKHVRSYDSKEPHRQQPKFRNNRSLSSGFRHSIRNLTSCALAR